MLDLAYQKAAALPASARDCIARELLEQLEALTSLRTDIKLAIGELDAGRSSPLELEAEVRLAHADYADRD
ncbi:MAG: hypothetical protein AB7F96_03420 [Beijerinckiaceae bacterium]